MKSSELRERMESSITCKSVNLVSEVNDGKHFIHSMSDIQGVNVKNVW